MAWFPLSALLFPLFPFSVPTFLAAPFFFFCCILAVGAAANAPRSDSKVRIGGDRAFPNTVYNETPPSASCFCHNTYIDRRRGLRIGSSAETEVRAEVEKGGRPPTTDHRRRGKADKKRSKSGCCHILLTISKHRTLAQPFPRERRGDA